VNTLTATPEPGARARSPRKIRSEAKLYLQEGRRILRKHKAKLEPPVREALEARILGLAAAREAKDAVAMQREIDGMAELLERDLAWAKKSALRGYLESILGAVLIALFVRAFIIEAFKIPSGSMIPTLKVGDHIFVNKFLYGFRVPFTTDPPRKFWRHRDPRRGEVVVFLYPDQPDKDYIKRIVALEGDTIRLRNDQVWLKRAGGPEFTPIPRRTVGRLRYCDHDERSDTWNLREGREHEETLDGVTYRVIGSNAPPTTGWGRALANARRLSRTEVQATHDTFGPIPAGHVFVLGDNRDNSHDSRYFGIVPLDYIKGKALWTWFSRGGRVQDGCAVSVRWERTFPRFHGVN
jgi:signal peptidase I